MYFRDRSQAGELLANQLMQYRFENTAVLSLSQGGVMVGEQIARRLHCTLSLLLTARITAPGEPSLILGTLDQEGTFTYNDLIPAGEMEEYLEDFRGYLEEEKIRRFYEMTSMVAAGGLASPDLLANRNVILATDGVKNGLSVDAALHYLKPIHTQKIIAAIPVGPADVIERLAERIPELDYLYVPDNFINVHHYYEDNTILDPDAVMDSINHIITRWI